jgi:translation initiation factor 1 (eIF-1/SUI1)
MDLELLDSQLEDHYVDIRSVQRNGRKYITTIEGLSTDQEVLKNSAKELRKLLNVSCSVDNTILKLSGQDHQTIIRYLKDKHSITRIRVNGIDIN